MNDEKQHLVGDAIDVALRIGALSDTSATAREIGTVKRVLAASPSYLRRAGTPELPADLSEHSIIVGPAGRGMEGWAFTKGSKTISIRVACRFILNGAEGASAAATAGLGIVSSSLLSLLREIEAGDLIRVSPDWDMGSADVHAIVPAGRAAKPRLAPSSTSSITTRAQPLRRRLLTARPIRNGNRKAALGGR